MVRHKMSPSEARSPPGMNMHTVWDKWVDNMKVLLDTVHADTFDLAVVANRSENIFDNDVKAKEEEEEEEEEEEGGGGGGGVLFHSCILQARCEAFKRGGHSESDLDRYGFESYTRAANNRFQVVLKKSLVSEGTRGAMMLIREFIYKASCDAVLDRAKVEARGDSSVMAKIFMESMVWGRRWGLNDFVKIAVFGAAKNLTVDNVLQYLCGLHDNDWSVNAGEDMDFSPSDDKKLERICKEGLGRDCMDFIIANLQTITANERFTKDLQEYPDLIMPILQKAAEKLPDAAPAAAVQRGKRRKLVVNKP